MNTLLLNSDYTPLKIINWKKTVIMYLEDSVYVLKYHDIVIRSQFLTINLPEIIVSKKYIKQKNEKTIIKPSRDFIFYRDNFKCKYCGKTLTREECTIDHITPKSRGGKMIYENLATSCLQCNQKKANRTPKEAGMDIRLPKQPNQANEKIKNMIRVLYPEWIEYIGL